MKETKYSAMSHVGTHLVASLVLLCADFLWVYFYMGSKYKQIVYAIQGEAMTPKWKFVVLSYVCMLVALNVITVPLTHTWADVFQYGSVLGFSLYSIYNGTCASVFTNFDIKNAMVDTLWGTFVYTLAGIAALIVSLLY